MTFEAQEESRESGNPVQLFKFIWGTEAGQYYAYTDHTEELTVDAITYAPVPIQRDNIESNGTLDKTALKIDADVGTDLAEIFRVYPPAYVVTLVIRQGHIGDADAEYLVTWSGRVIAAGRQGSRLLLSGEPVSSSLLRPGLRRNYQYGCPHQLYGPHCQANKAVATVSATVDSIDGATVTLVAGWQGAFDSTKFLGGLLEWVTDDGSTDRRTIIRLAEDTLSLSGIPQGLAAADAVDVVLGCNHKAYADEGGDCLPLHNNILNYGGDLWIPTKNPIGTYNNYY